MPKRTVDIEGERQDLVRKIVAVFRDLERVRQADWHAVDASELRRRVGVATTNGRAAITRWRERLRRLRALEKARASTDAKRAWLAREAVGA